jgi:hypothetical protein
MSIRIVDNTLGRQSQRLGLVYSAKSEGELASVVKDLQPVPWPSGTPTPAKDVGVLSDFVRMGRWLVGDKHRATAVISSGVIGLRLYIVAVAVANSADSAGGVPIPLRAACRARPDPAARS